MPTIPELAGLSRRYTNHCVRTTAITLWSDNNIPNRHIMSISGHANEQSLVHYNRCPTSTQLEVCSDVLAQATDKEAQQQETTTKTFATTVSPTASATISVLLSQPFIYQPSSENRMVMFPTGLFHGCSINNVNVNISNN